AGQLQRRPILRVQAQERPGRLGLADQPVNDSLWARVVGQLVALEGAVDYRRAFLAVALSDEGVERHLQLEALVGLDRAGRSAGEGALEAVDDQVVGGAVAAVEAIQRQIGVGDVPERRAGAKSDLVATETVLLVQLQQA